MGLALLELDRATGDGRFRFAAEMAFLYERRLFNEERSNWPDLRHDLFDQPVDELRRAVRDGKPPVYEETYMTAWCHGAPGIGLARLRAFELTGQDVYRQEAEAALRSTLQAVEDELSQGGNYSLCHGIGGNCELPLLAAELLGDPELRQVAERAARARHRNLRGAGTALALRNPRRCAGSQPARGRGRNRRLLSAPRRSRESVGPPAAPASRKTRRRDKKSGNFRQLAQESVDDFFATTLRVWSRFAPPGPLCPPGDRAASLSSVLRWKRLTRSSSPVSGKRAGSFRARLEDAFEPERVRYQLTLELVDFSGAVLRLLVRPAWEEIDLRSATFTLTPGTRLLSTAMIGSPGSRRSGRRPRAAA